MSTYDAYLDRLAAAATRAPELRELVDRVVINETSFFRNEPQLRVFEERTLPTLLAARAATKRLRIWSAACSTGEEPYTLAIIVHRALGAALASWNVEILGTDISERALAAARAATYPPYALRGTPQPVRDRYFTAANGSSLLDQSVRSMVAFEPHNLGDASGARRLGVWDAVFCRNAMIYFDAAMKRRVASVLAGRLAPDGVLFIGHSERLDDVTDALARLPYPQGFCYGKAA